MFLKIFWIFLIFNINLYAQINTTNQTEKIFFDAILFKGDSLNLSRLDCYIVVPYSELNFIKVNNFFATNYNIIINVYDSKNNLIDTKKTNKNIRVEEYSVAQGATGAIDYHQEFIYLKEGDYQIEVVLQDDLQNLQFSRKRQINVINFDNYNFSLSGIMLLSSVEEINGRYKITPHISDNIGNLVNGFFTFFESYNKNNKYDSIDFVWEILDLKSQLVAYSNRIRRTNKDTTNRIIINIPAVKELTTGNYTLRIIALEPLNIDEYSDKSALAITKRSISYIKTVAGNIISDINNAIRQLRYVANRDEIEFIQSASTESEKIKRFEEFWKNLDPSKGTDRNEAFDEYYYRINYANQNFKSFQEGWLTDMGMIYVIFGDPITIDRQTGYGDGKTYERWIYQNNREFIFVDNTGFGDFRLIRPLTVTEKYRYRN